MIDNSKTQTNKSQTEITPEDAISLLKKGNNRFLKNKFLNRDYKEQISNSSNGQHPFAIVLSCIDSRVPVEIIFDQGIGDLFSVRVAGNVVSKDVLGSIEYACKYAGVKLIVILGHTSCGAVKGACDGLEDGNLTHLLQKIKPAIDKTKTDESEIRDSSNIHFVNSVANNNLNNSINDIKSHSIILKEMIDSDTVSICSAMYDVETGIVNFKS
jgi:carbonic anhydrase